MSDERYVKVTPAHAIALMVAANRCERDGFENVGAVVSDVHAAFDAAEGQRVERVSWCITHNHEYLYHARHPEDPNACVMVEASLILPPEASS